MKTRDTQKLLGKFQYFEGEVHIINHRASLWFVVYNSLTRFWTCTLTADRMNNLIVQCGQVLHNSRHTKNICLPTFGLSAPAKPALRTPVPLSTTTGWFAIISFTCNVESDVIRHNLVWLWSFVKLCQLNKYISSCWERQTFNSCFKRIAMTSTEHCRISCLSYVYISSTAQYQNTTINTLLESKNSSSYNASKSLRYIRIQRTKPSWPPP